MNQESQTWRCCILLTILCMCCKDFHSLLVLMKKTLFYPELHHLKGQSFIEQQERPKRHRRRGRRPKKHCKSKKKKGTTSDDETSSDNDSSSLVILYLQKLQEINPSSLTMYECDNNRYLERFFSVLPGSMISYVASDQSSLLTVPT